MATKQQLAKEAILIQDACNPSAVAHFLTHVFRFLSEEGADTKAKCEDPIVRLVVSKLHDLCHLGFSDIHPYGAAYEACKEIANATE